MLNQTYHVATVKDLGQFDPNTLKVRKMPVTGIEEIWGKLKDGSGVATHSYRFPSDGFSPKKCKEWLADQKINYQDFNEAEDSGAGVTKTKTSASDILIAKNLFGKEARSILAYEAAINKTSNPELKKVLSRILAEKKVTADQVLKWYAKA